MRNRIDYDPVYFATQSGKEPVKVWIDDLNEDQQKSVFAAISSVVQHFPNIPKSNLLRKISGSKYEDMWEIRIRLIHKMIARILFYVHDSKIVFLHAFIKKSNRTPKKDLDLAIRRKREYLDTLEDYVDEKEQA